MSAIIESPILWKIGSLFAAIVISIAALTAFTAVYTRLRYKYQLYRLSSASSAKGEFQKPPQIPYNIPFLGHAIEFLAPKPGLFWQRLFRTHPRPTGAITLLLGGETTHILFDPTAVQALFKARKPNRDEFNDRLVMNALGLSRSETDKFYGHKEPSPNYDANGKDISAKKVQDDIWHEYLIKTENVNELTSEFLSRLQGFMEEDKRISKGEFLEIGITQWLRPIMFEASAIALLGSLILEVYPEMEQDFWPFDQALLGLFFGLPKAMLEKEHEALEKAMAGMQKWHQAAKIKSSGKPMDPHGPTAWEPCYGARVTRARQYFYEQRGISNRSRAAMDLGFVFGLSSNAIPCACWMLMHILDSRGDSSLHKRLMEEIFTVKNNDGSVDVQKLVGLPVLQAVFHEVLRLYTDVLVTRSLPEDLVLPFDNGRSKMAFRKGTMVMAPSFISHNDKMFWETSSDGAPYNVFWPDRFLKTNPESGLTTFTSTGTAGKFFPFGGGRTICPGRVFAKQEVLAAVALTLLNFDIEDLGYLDLEGKPTNKFPGMRDAYQGSGIVVMDGDLKVRIKRKF